MACMAAPLIFGFGPAVYHHPAGAAFAIASSRSALLGAELEATAEAFRELYPEASPGWRFGTELRSEIDSFREAPPEKSSQEKIAEKILAEGKPTVWKRAMRHLQKDGVAWSSRATPSFFDQHSPRKNLELPLLTDPTKCSEGIHRSANIFLAEGDHFLRRMERTCEALCQGKIDKAESETKDTVAVAIEMAHDFAALGESAFGRNQNRIRSEWCRLLEWYAANLGRHFGLLNFFFNLKGPLTEEVAEAAILFWMLSAQVYAEFDTATSEEKYCEALDRQWALVDVSRGKKKVVRTFKACDLRINIGLTLADRNPPAALEILGETAAFVFEFATRYHRTIDRNVVLQTMVEKLHWRSLRAIMHTRVNSEIGAPAENLAILEDQLPHLLERMAEPIPEGMEWQMEDDYGHLLFFKLVFLFQTADEAAIKKCLTEALLFLNFSMEDGEWVVRFPRHLDQPIRYSVPPDFASEWKRLVAQVQRERGRGD